MILFRMFFVFEGLWWKFFSALEAWIRRASPICGLLRFLEAFELDSSDLWDLGRWFGWFLFECSSYSKLKFLKFLEASKLGSNRASGLLNLGPFPALLQLQPLPRLFQNVLGRFLLIGVWGWWVTRGGVWLVTHVTAWLVRLCHRLHARGLLVSSLIRARLLVSSLTHARLLVSLLTRAEVWLVLTWHLANFWWFLSSDSKI